jgi:hypothetical protein
VQLLWKSVQRLLKKLKVELSCALAIPLLGIHTKESKSVYYRDTHIPMFIVVLLIIAKLWNQPRCLSTDEWAKKMWHIYTMECYSAIKKNEVMSFSGKWRGLENNVK